MAYQYNARAHNPYYRSWRWMKSVCLNERTPQYEKYGALGVTTYWSGKYDYDAFLAWVLTNLGPRPDGHVLARKDKLGNFEPGNLCWETAVERGRNSPRQNVTASYRRKKQTLADWSEQLGIPYYTLNRRVKKGLTMAEIIKEFK